MLKKEGFRPFLLILIIIEFTLPTLQTDRRNEFRKPFLCVYALEKYEIKSWTRGRDKFLEFLIGFYTVIFSRKVSFVIFVKVVQYVLGEYVEPFKKGNIEEGKNEKFLCPAAPQLLLAKFPFKKSFWIFQTTFHFPTTAGCYSVFRQKSLNAWHTQLSFIKMKDTTQKAANSEVSSPNQTHIQTKWIWDMNYLWRKECNCGYSQRNVVWHWTNNLV